MVVVVWMFIRHLASRDEAQREGYHALIEEHLYAREQSRSVIAENSKALRENAETRSIVVETLHRLNDKLDKKP